jgi:transposase
MTRSSQSARDWKEGRRLRAWELFAAGWKQKDIAAALGVTKGAVSQWIKCARERGTDALGRRLSRGPTPRLTDEQKATIPRLLAQGAASYGFRGDLWTCERVAAVIKREFGVTYHPAHVSRLLKECEWTPQKPIRRSSQRNEQAIAAWASEQWPALKKRLPQNSGRSSSLMNQGST